MACKTGGAGLNNVYENFGYNEDKIFIMAYADGFNNATMIGTYNLIPLELKFPLVCQEGGSEKIDSVLGHPYNGGWLLHPDGRIEEVSYKEDILTNKLNEVLSDSCNAETANDILQFEDNANNHIELSTYGNTGSVMLKTLVSGIYTTSIFSINGRKIIEQENHCVVGNNNIEIIDLAQGLYIINVSGPIGKIRQIVNIRSSINY